LALRNEHIAGLQEALRIFSRQGIGSSSTAATAAAAQPPHGSFLAATAAAAAGDSKQNGRKEDSWEGEGTCSEALAAAGAAGRAVSEVWSTPPAATATTAAAGEPVSAAAAAATAAAATTAADGLAKVMEDALAPDFKPLTQDRGYTAEVCVCVLRYGVVMPHVLALYHRPCALSNMHPTCIVHPLLSNPSVYVAGGCSHDLIAIVVKCAATCCMSQCWFVAECVYAEWCRLSLP
jgi:hypothetical protein